MSCLTRMFRIQDGRFCVSMAVCCILPVPCGPDKLLSMLIAQHINKLKNAFVCFWQPSYFFINKNYDILIKMDQLFGAEF